MRSLFLKSSLVFLAFTAVSCFEESEPNYEYMPDMYRDAAYETYNSYEVFPNEQEALLPAEGTVPRGWMPYEYENSNEDYEAAKVNLENPLPYTEENVAAGEYLYGIYCAVCHGETGDGQGILVEREKFLGIPSYDDPGRAITQGSIYHVMYFGRNAMGSYASQTTELERWQISHYVMSLKDALEGEPARAFEEAGVEVEAQEGTAEPEEGMETIAPAMNVEETGIPEVLNEGEETEENNTNE